MVESPGQKFKLPMIKGDGGVRKEVVTLVLRVQLLLLVTVTVKVAAVLTLIVWMVAPVDQL